MIMRLLTLVVMATVLANAATAAPTIALQSGQPVNVQMPGSSFSTSYYIDVGANDAQLQVQLDNQSNDDIDFVLRYGTPFADVTANEGATPDADLFLDYAHYWGLSPTGDESVVVQKSSTIPLRAGRWYIALLNQTSTAQNLTLNATLRSTVATAAINFFYSGTDGCVRDAWFDTTATVPIDGNSGTTLGEQRRNALAQAGQLLASQLKLPIGLRVSACWQPLGGSRTDGARIAFAGPTEYVFDSADFSLPWLPDKYTWYSVTEMVRRSGGQQCATLSNDCSTAYDIEATFNSDLDPPVNIIGAPFYYGFTGSNKPRSSIDFVTTTMHELTHGLGFLSVVNVDPQNTRVPLGARARASNGLSYDDAFSRQLALINTQTRTYKPFLGVDTTDAERAAALTTPDSVRWSGMEAVNSPRNEKRNEPMPDSFPALFTPCDREAPNDPCTTLPGSTLSHTVQPGDLMNAFDSGLSNRDLGLALPMLNALGWSNDDAPTPRYAVPITGNWYDRTRSGHGLDFQLYSRDAVNGDLYFVIFYTFEADNLPEYYFGLGRLIDGKFIGAKQADGIALMRLRYNAASRRTELDRSSSGQLFIDFNQATQSPSCRRASRSGAGALAVMKWSIRSERDTWCIEPAVLASARTTPDFSGHWYSGNGNDLGWGMELLSIRGSAGQSQLVAVVYYPDLQGRSRWAITALADVNLASTPALALNEVTSGYCRTCTTPTGATQTRIVGTIQLKLTQPTRVEPADGANRVSISISIPGVAEFRRNDVPLTLLSAPPGL
ncbi:MAG: hypothetical protein JNN30_12085 [Rhodanobacteraceae bacterium]|nr:hypothetical protein [Rhodanobacteraceae bacterium]